MVLWDPCVGAQEGRAMERNRIGRQSATASLKLCLCIFWIVLLVFSHVAASVDAAEQRAQFRDVFSWQWHAAIVERAHTAGILEGYPDGTFQPERIVSCAEFLRMAVPSIAGTEAAIGEEGKTQHWAQRYYDEGLRRNLFTEADIMRSALDRPIARGVMALVYSRLLEDLESFRLAGGKYTVPKAPFYDIDERSMYEYPIAHAAAVGVLQGYPDGSFRPESFLTRAEAAAAFVRLLDLPGEGSGGGPGDLQIGAPQPGGPDIPQPGGPGTLQAGETQPGDPGNPQTGGPYPGGSRDGNADSPKPSIPISELATRTAQSYLDLFQRSVRFYGTPGNYYYRFEVPGLPDGYQNHVSVKFFSPAGSGIFPNDRHFGREPEPRIVEKRIASLQSLSQLGMAYMQLDIHDLAAQTLLGYSFMWKPGEGTNLRIQFMDIKTNKVVTEYYPDVLGGMFTWK